MLIVRHGSGPHAHPSIHIACHNSQGPPSRPTYAKVPYDTLAQQKRITRFRSAVHPARPRLLPQHAFTLCLVARVGASARMPQTHAAPGIQQHPASPSHTNPHGRPCLHWALRKRRCRTPPHEAACTPRMLIYSLLLTSHPDVAPSPLPSEFSLQHEPRTRHQAVPTPLSCRDEWTGPTACQYQKDDDTHAPSSQDTGGKAHTCWPQTSIRLIKMLATAGSIITGVDSKRRQRDQGSW